MTSPFEQIDLVTAEMCFNGSVTVWGLVLLVKVNSYKLVINTEMWRFTLILLLLLGGVIRFAPDLIS